MARGFAGSTTFAKRKRLKLLYTICGLGGVVVLLFSLVTYLVLHESNSSAATISSNEVVAQTKAELVDVLVAANRIESGTRLDTSMFTLLSYERNRLPYGVVLASHQDMVLGKYAKQMIRPGFPVSQEDLSERAPSGDILIPPGFRAVSIFGTQTELVNGYVTPNSRVDVLFHYIDERGRKAVKTLIEFVKVLSVDGTKQQGKRNVSNGATATLLVSSRDAQRVELARQMGSLTLALRGLSSSDTERTSDSPVVPCELIGGCHKDENREIAGTMIIPSPEGRLVKYILVDNQWIRASEDEEQI